MIIVGTYPELLGTPAGAQLEALRRVLENFLPAGIAVHLLPVYPSSGDGGFAPDDWYSVRPELGDWSLIKDWARNRKLIIDGVYNHTGRGHNFVREFFSFPTEDGPLYAFRADSPPSNQTSPRGGSVFREYELQGRKWQLWQTFSKDSFDIRLSCPRVREEIERHLSFLAESGIHGVRLDGCAYYGHQLSVEQFHNPEGLGLTREIARKANTVGLTVFAQLDADPAGAAYFPRAGGWAVPVVDYAYSAVLVLSLLSQSARSLKDHVNRTKALPCDALRPPRTHDGILLQSDQLTQEEFREIAAVATQWHLPVRIANGDAYELNSSFPFICNLGVSPEQGWSRLLLSLALTAILPGIPYLYLPMLANHQPETTYKHQDGDPRSLNRTRLSLEFLQASLQGSSGRELRKVLTDMEAMQSRVSSWALNATTTGGPSGDSALLIHNHEDRWTFACNLSTAHTITILTPANSKLICSRNAKGNCVSPLGFGFWVEDDQ